MKSEKVKVNKKKTSDDKSGVFSLHLQINQECVSTISACDFYYKSFNPKTGEVRKNKNDWVRALAMISLISSKDNKTKNIGSRLFKDIKEDYNPLLEKLIEINVVICHASPSVGSAGEYSINPSFVGECNITCSEKQYKDYTAFFTKQYNRGEKSNTNKPIYISISKELFSELYDVDFENRKKLKKYNDKMLGKDEMWKVIDKINQSNKINAHGKRESRIYSDITSLSSFIHPYILIGGRNVVELDLHATYWMILPSFLEKHKKTVPEYDEFLKDINNQIDSFRQFLKDSTNVYQSIANIINSDKDSVKAASMIYICEKQPNMSGDAEKIQNWMKKEYPLLNNIINLNRKNSKISYRLQEIEANMFITAARRLTKDGIDVLTKHDALLCFNEDIEKCEAALRKTFAKQGVGYRCRIKMYDISSPKGSESFASSASSSTQDSNSDFGPLSAEIQEIHPVRNGVVVDSIRVTFRNSESLKDQNQSTNVIITVAEEGDEALARVTPNEAVSVVNSLKGPKQARTREIEIKNHGKRLRVKHKGQWISSNKNETYDQFKKRIEEEYPDIKIKEK